MVPTALFAEANPLDPSVVCTIVVMVLALAALIVYRFRRSRRLRRIAKKNSMPFVYPTHPIIEPDNIAPFTPTPWPIEIIRQLLGPPPRSFDPKLAQYLTVLPPKWMEANPNDEEWVNIHRQEQLRRDGPIVWGTIVQANSHLFKRNNIECGASIIYSPDPWFDRHRDALRHIARQCSTLKGTDPADPESAAFARMLTNEFTRAMGMKAPGIFSEGRKVFHSSMLMPRKHLSKGFLSGSFFPVWIDPREPGAVIMVPAAWWPPSLTSEWERE